jgi:putative aldouronate transport system permease protein
MREILTANSIKTSTAYKIFTMFNYLIMLFLSAVCLLPLINVAAMSLSASTPVKANQVTFWPIGFNIENYRYVLEKAYILNGLKISVFRVLAGTVLSMFITFITAYPLSHYASEMKGRNVLMWLFIVPMLFSGGLIPSALLYYKIHIYDTFLVLILPSAVNFWNIILMSNFFKRLPRALQESAKLDGASHFTILLRIYLPLSMASIATLSLFSAVAHWNAWFDGLVFIDRSTLRPLQSLIKATITQMQGATTKILTSTDAQRLAYISDRSLLCAQIIFGTMPILCVYPFAQRYFISGITIGAVKG